MNRSFGLWAIALMCLVTSWTWAADLDKPIVGEDVVFQEVDGIVAVEAEFFYKQSAVDKRRWYRTSANEAANVGKDGDPPHVANASNNAYLEILPDTRRNHGEKLIAGENFSNNPTPPMAVVHYKVHFSTAGRYYVWVRAFSTGSEDNGIHVGIDGTWPETGHRLQWCKGKKTWHWESKQRTAKVHCGEPYKIYLDIEPGLHEITFAMREDGFEFDKWFMTLDREFERPADAGPAVKILQGTVPPPYPVVAPTTPAVQPAPAAKPAAKASFDGVHVMKATDFPADGTNYYVNNKWLAINPNDHKKAETRKPFPFASGTYDVVFYGVGENDGKSEFRILKNDQEIGHFVCPLSTETHAEGKAHNELWENIEIAKGDAIAVVAKVGSKDGDEFSRGRWAGLAFAPVGKGKTILGTTLNQAQAPAAQTSAATSEAPAQENPEDKLTFSNPKERLPDGNGDVTISGTLKQWHKVTLTLDGPFAHEFDNQPNPFTDCQMTVVFQHSSGEPSYTVQGYFAADGKAAETSADRGTKWRAHLSPDKPGQWSYKVIFLQGKGAALSGKGERVRAYHGKTGTFKVGKTNKKGKDLRAKGRLQYVGKHHLQFAGNGDYFLKAGADAPETLLAYVDFDATYTVKRELKTWKPHLKDWKKGDPTWQGGKGKGLIGAVNYLAAKGANVFSFLPYNAGGDGDNVWPFIKRDAKFHYDCSKLDQWAIVFDHAQTKGMYLHFKMQEQENDDNRKGSKAQAGAVPASLDDGDLGPERKLYCRELIARYGYLLALNWNLGEENTQSKEQQEAMAAYIDKLDVFNHNIVVHTFPSWQDRVYNPLLGDNNSFTGASLQNHWDATHKRTLQWVTESAAAGKPWVVANDEQGSAGQGVPPDPGYEDFEADKLGYDLHDVRKQTLWGNLMAGGAGVEYYFGYKLPQNDLICEDFRSRDRSWDFCRIALQFFPKNKIPFQDMVNRNALIGNSENSKEKYCLAQDGEIYLVYLGYVPTSTLDLSGVEGSFKVKWFNPRTGGKLKNGSVKKISGGGVVDLGQAPADEKEDWLVVVRK